MASSAATHLTRRVVARPGRIASFLRSDAVVACLGIMGATALVLIVMFLISWQLYRERYGWSLGDYLELFF